MNKIFRISSILLIGILAIGTILLIIVFGYFPNAGSAPDIHVVASPERIARGNYIFNQVAGCVSCHSQRNDNLLTMPVVKGSEGSGGEVFNQQMGFPGSFTAKNVTPFHLNDWKDGEIYRAIVCGVSKNGAPLFPVMPYPNYAQMDTEDIYSLIAYIRTLKPVAAEWPDSHFDFPMNIIVRLIPSKNTPVITVDTADSRSYGKYLVTMANCKTCHTQAVRGKIIEALAFGGGRQMGVPTGGFVQSANISPDLETGIGRWTKENFIQRFRSYNDSIFRPSRVGKNQFNTVMPWTMFATLNSRDLGAIYDYLRALKPIKNRVLRFSTAK